MSFVVDLTKLSAEQQAMLQLWEEHLKAEFEEKSAKASCDTMVENPYVNHVPTLTGGVGRPQLEHFYGEYFIPHMPTDVNMVPVSRTIGIDRIVDEFVFQFTHSLPMEWLLPGVPPTGKWVEVPMLVLVEFRQGRISAERIHWDQATVLVQVGLLDPKGLPVSGVEAAQKVLDPTSVPSNLLVKRTIEDDRL